MPDTDREYLIALLEGIYSVLKLIGLSTLFTVALLIMLLLK
jgi:hypothetical protein